MLRRVSERAPSCNCCIIYLPPSFADEVIQYKVTESTELQGSTNANILRKLWTSGRCRDLQRSRVVHGHGIWSYSLPGVVIPVLLRSREDFMEVMFSCYSYNPSIVCSVHFLGVRPGKNRVESISLKNIKNNYTRSPPNLSFGTTCVINRGLPGAEASSVKSFHDGGLDVLYTTSLMLFIYESEHKSVTKD